MVLIDYMMPGLDGLGFLSALRAAPACEDCLVIMVTANHNTKLKIDALEAGANDFLTKPVEQAEFRARVKNMLALRQMQLSMKDRAAWLAEEVRKATQQIREQEREAIFLFSRAAEYRDPETGAHIVRMAKYSALIADGIQLDAETVALIEAAASMHDIGKVGTPDRILLKPGKLDPDEWIIMRQHASIGYEILANSQAPLLTLAASIALHHHEKFDGSGYPNGLAGDAIPIEGRIVAIADVFDALTSTRPYKPAWEVERALQYLQDERGRHFDARLVDVFLAKIDQVKAIMDQYTDITAEGPAT
jgi:putative two-component system response regulator